MSFGIYETVTNRIIAELEAGAIPWTQPWKNQKSGDVMPLNRATGRPYSGINIPILWGAASAFGYPTHQWLTFKQALEMKACVKKGEKGTQVVFTKRRDQKALDAFINAINFYIRPLRFAQVIKAPRTANGDTAQRGRQESRVHAQNWSEGEIPILPAGRVRDANLPLAVRQPGHDLNARSPGGEGRAPGAGYCSAISSFLPTSRPTKLPGQRLRATRTAFPSGSSFVR